MKQNLSPKEYELLMLYYRCDKGESNMYGLIQRKDPDGKILRRLYDKGYINGVLIEGVQKKDEESFVSINLKVNGYTVSDFAIYELNLDLPQKV